MENRKCLHLVTGQLWETIAFHCKARNTSAHSHLIFSLLQTSDVPCLSAQGQLWSFLKRVLFLKRVHSFINSGSLHLQKHLTAKSFWLFWNAGKEGLATCSVRINCSQSPKFHRCGRLFSFSPEGFCSSKLAEGRAWKYRPCGTLVC